MTQRLLRFVALSGFALAVSACGGSGESSLGTSVAGAPNVVGTIPSVSEATPSITGEQAAALADQALQDSLLQTPNTIAIGETETTITVQGTIDEGGATATVDVTITKHPFSVDGAIAIATGSDTALVTIAGGQATVTIDGQPAGTYSTGWPSGS